MSLAETYLPEVAPAQESPRVEMPFRIQPLKALRALGRLLKNKEDTAQVFEIMRALSGRSIPNGYARLLEDAGRRIDRISASRTRRYSFG